MAEKKKLTISSCTVDKKGNVSVQSKKFEAMLNPTGYKHTHTIKYVCASTPGQLGSDLKFNAIDPEDFVLDILMDGTGVVPGSEDVNAQLKKLNDIIYKYQGDKHEPNHVQILWGSLIFYGRLSSMTVDFTLFTPDGNPLRAKVNMKFKEFISNVEENLKANKSSPDLTHIVKTKAGDRLPLLCYKIYGDPSYYPEVARINNITNFRDIKPGTSLYFPPLR